MARAISPRMTNLAKDFRALHGGALHAGAAGDRHRTDFRTTARANGCCAPGRASSSRPCSFPEPDRGTLCVSSQVGCTLNCRFCHTGTQKLVRNLTPGEIVGQVMVARDALGDWPSTARTGAVTNVVMMGMGEPLYNFDNVKAALAIVTDGDGLALSQAARHAFDGGRRADDPARGRGDRLGAGDFAACGARRGARRASCRSTRNIRSPNCWRPAAPIPALSNARRITFEYVMLKGVNDSLADARELVRLIRGIPGQDQSHPVQSLARRALRMLRLGADREIRRDRQPRRLRLAGPHAARPRHHGRLRPAQERKREANARACVTREMRSAELARMPG